MKQTLEGERRRGRGRGGSAAATIPLVLTILMMSCFKAEGNPTTPSATSQSPDPTTTIATSTISRNVSIHSCCMERGVTDSCQNFCTTDVDLLYANLGGLVACFQFLGDFLLCTSGGQSYTGCCQRSGVTPDCLYLCSGDGTIGTTDVHSVIQCLISSSASVLGCFNDGIPDMNTTVSGPSTTLSPIATDVCLLPSDVGSCPGSLQRWYYSAKDRACATFVYGGCGGNGNNFFTKDDCLARCIPSRSLCPDIMCPSDCQIVLDEYSCHSCKCNNTCQTDGCPANQQCQMMPGSCTDPSANCPPVPMCVSMPDMICEPMANCSLTCTDGWMTGPNGCPVCQCVQTTQCQPSCTGMICFYGRVKDGNGCDTCSCYEPCALTNCSDQCRVMKNNVTQEFYGECYGTTTSRTTPGARAPMPLLCTLPPDYGMLCQRNSTRWFYNMTSDSCQPFTFGGCQGNDNNFQNFQICSALCVVTACPQEDCRTLLPCDYGLKTDDNGCIMCQCYDPCEGVVCPNNQVCVSSKVDCPSDVECRDPSTRQCVDSLSTVTPSSSAALRPTTTTSNCPLMTMCQMYCQYGMKKNMSTGCSLCQCVDPCENCTANQRCLTMQIDCPENDQGCASSVIGQCVDKPTTLPSTSSIVPSTQHLCLLCMMRCTYGMLQDANGCSVCRCYDPCQGLNCAANNTCQVVQLDCPADTDCPPNMMYIGQCIAVSITVSVTVSSSSSSSSVTPTTVRLCVSCDMQCPYGMLRGSDGCPICTCYDPCKSQYCQRDERCDVVQQNCSAPGSSCDPQVQFTAVCAPLSSTVTVTTSTSVASMTCPPPAMCTEYCTYGMMTDSNGCHTCQCFDPCQGVTCNATQLCQPTSYQVCSGDMCQLRYKGVCQNKPKVCSPLVTCTLQCPYGMKKDGDGCSICQCLEPCQNTTCLSGFQCQVHNETICTSGQCNVQYTGYCAVICPLRPLCTISCDYGLIKDSIGCEICKCNDPCANVTCQSGMYCTPDTIPTFIGDPIERIYLGQCIGCAVSSCNTSMICQFGLARDSNGCTVCQCHDPCQNVTCPMHAKCILPSAPTNVYNRDGSITQAFIGQCIACPVVMCGTNCWYGIQEDSQGCMTSCNCNPDPCLSATCDNSTEVCQAILFDPLCTGDGCTPTTVCVDKSQPCTALQMTYLTSFASNLNEMPQLNCDLRGNFKPIQCYNSLCWCVDANGKPTSAKSTTVTLPQCYPNGQSNNVLKIAADINVVQPADGWKFKQQVSQQIANNLQINESMVVVTKYESGSIMTQFVVGTDANANLSSIQYKMNLLTNPVTISYNGIDYLATLQNASTTSASVGSTSSVTKPPVSSSTPGLPPASFTSVENPPWPTATANPPVDHTLLIILVCVFVPIAFVITLFSVWLACKLYKGERIIPRRLTEESKSSTQFDSLESNIDKGTMEKKKEKKKKKSLPRDTTEA